MSITDEELAQLRKAMIEAIALLDVAIAGTVFTKPQAGRVIVNVERAQKVLDGLRGTFHLLDELARLRAPLRAPSPAGVKMRVDQDWLTRHVETDPDCAVEAGYPSPAGEEEEGITQHIGEAEMSITPEELAEWERLAQSANADPDFDKWPDWKYSSRIGPVQVLKLISQLRAQAAWRPIESAPRDGTNVLISRSNGGLWIASANHLPPAKPYDWPPGWGFPDDATHWMPLPPPPQDSSRDGSETITNIGKTVPTQPKDTEGRG